MAYIDLDIYHGKKIKTITPYSGLFSSKEKLIFQFFSGKNLTIIPEDTIGLIAFIHIIKYNYSNCIEVMTLGRNNLDIHLFPNSSFHPFFKTEEISGFFLLNNLIIESITCFTRPVTAQKSIIYLIIINGEVDFNNGYNYISHLNSVPNLTGKSKVNLTINPRVGLGDNYLYHGIIIK